MRQDPATTRDLRGVWGASATDIYVVGDDATLLHWDGRVNWTPVVSGGYGTLYAIWGSGPEDVYVVGGSDLAGGFVLHNR